VILKVPKSNCSNKYSVFGSETTSSIGDIKGESLSLTPQAAKCGAVIEDLRIDHMSVEFTCFMHCLNMTIIYTRSKRNRQAVEEIVTSSV